MSSDESSREPTLSAAELTANKESRGRRIALVLASITAAYLMIAYFIMPLGWVEYEHRHPAIDETPGISTTADDHPGDPMNVALIGSEADLKEAMLKSGWFEADSLGLKSDLKIAADTMLKRPDKKAPVSNLFLWGRKEDLAFEQPVGGDPRQRHHVRFWKSAKLDDKLRPAWLGSATYDKRVGLSHTTGQVTHHIAADVDAERDHLFASLKKSGVLTDVQIIDNFHKVCDGRNGGGDAWHTDGRLFSGTVVIPADK